MIYELRIYHMNEGKQPDIHKRFSEVTLRLFERHGMKVRDFFTDASGEERIYYILAFDSLEQKESQWASFKADPEWIQKKEASHANGVIVHHVDSFIMERVPYITPTWGQEE